MMRTNAIVALALIYSCFSASAEPIHLQLRWHHQFQFAGYYAALEKGYYKDAGLDVIIHEGTPEKNRHRKSFKAVYWALSLSIIDCRYDRLTPKSA